MLLQLVYLFFMNRWTMNIYRIQRQLKTIINEQNLIKRSAITITKETNNTPYAGNSVDKHRV